ncbi:cytochrome c oxidase assembly protein subunit 11 [Devosia lucknowensis]|uniref:Cytochrome c oxidase assembly protein CtaG n=1 Tax=Devosia lucknowensis TaxID=1096929 RepID=A0A1Y6EAQ7_9HYPH|nr:cytochrome c oxidase assembly protein [Devosia lucknowensis]SMQ59657.1 cytochrome c oxidase assembly protein subunit 11 [Devosia lucknowensis]
MADTTSPTLPMNNGRSNKRTATILGGLALGMVGLAFASVPLYQLFCQVTGFGGTTQVATDNPKGVIAREMKVRFDVNIDPALDWTVKPAAPITDQIGRVDTVNYIATNHSDKPVTGQAIFNVVPEKAGLYFNKIECFCFTEQTLQPGETVEMPIVFFVDPDLADNHELNTIKEITLSYTFYASDSEGS